MSFTEIFILILKLNVQFPKGKTTTTTLQTPSEPECNHNSVSVIQKLKSRAHQGPFKEATCPADFHLGLSCVASKIFSSRVSPAVSHHPHLSSGKKI